jgi:hypothetical protein
LLTVIAIIGILAAITIPNLSSFKPNVMAAGTSQLLSDVGRARQLAISRRTDVYMVFVPPGFWTTDYNNGRALQQGTESARVETLYDKQYVGYTFVALRRLGDQPGAGVPQYLSEWRTLPAGVIIAQSKFFQLNQPPFVISDNNETILFRAFEVTNNIPFPTELAASPPYAVLPYIAFNYLGGLKPRPGMDVAQDEFIPLALGSTGISRDPSSKKPLANLAVPQENPPGNSTNAFNIIRIDGLTGRARVERREIQ